MSLLSYFYSRSVFTLAFIKLRLFPFLVEETYFAHLDHTGRRTDIQHRQELYLGSYEFVATKLYCKNSIPPKQPAFIFFLDVSYNAMRSGLIDLFCTQLPTLLKNLPRYIYTHCFL